MYLVNSKEYTNYPVALVTGGAKRLGREFALFLAAQGYDIALHYNNSHSEAESTAEDIRKLGRSCRIYQADFSTSNGSNGLINSVWQDFGRIDLLLNSASLMQRAPLTETDGELFDLMQNVNFRAAYFLTRDLALKEQNSLVVNILDTRIVKNQFVFSAYLLSKKALAEFTKMVALELAPRIRVNGIAPGLILPVGTESDDYLNKIITKNPQKRQGLAENLQQALDYLIKNTFVTGEILFVDGGEHLN